MFAVEILTIDDAREMSWALEGKRVRIIPISTPIIDVMLATELPRQNRRGGYLRVVDRLLLAAPANIRGDDGWRSRPAGNKKIGDGDVAANVGNGGDRWLALAVKFGRQHEARLERRVAHWRASKCEILACGIWLNRKI